MSVFRETNCVIPNTTIARLFYNGLPYTSLASKSDKCMESWVVRSCIAIPRPTLHGMARVSRAHVGRLRLEITRQRICFQVYESTLPTMFYVYIGGLNSYDWELKVGWCISLFFGFQCGHAKSTSKYSPCFWRALGTCRRLYCTRGPSVTGILNLPAAFLPLFYGSVCFYLCS